MAMYLNEYGIVDTSYIVHACPIDPCEADDDEPWLIGLILHIGQDGFRCSLEYPNRQRRDEAFEEICALVRADAMTMDDDEEEAL